MILLDLTNISTELTLEYVINFLQALDYFHKVYNINEFVLVDLNTNNKITHRYKPLAEFSEEEINNLVATYQQHVYGIDTTGWC